MSYNSKYKGSEVEELLESIGNKVDKVDGKQLSTEDFTTFLKQKLDGLSSPLFFVQNTTAVEFHNTFRFCLGNCAIRRCRAHIG